MAFIGDPDPWAGIFPQGLIPNILHLVVSVWAGFTKPKPYEHEVPITRRFRAALVQEKNVQRKLPVRILREVVEDDLKTGDELGRIDMVFLSSQSCREDVYFAFECKRLNVIFETGLDTLASKYVSKGVMRFINEQYASEMVAGGMIGYVMNNDLDGAIKAVHNSIKNQSKNLMTKSLAGLTDSSFWPTDKQIKESYHYLRNNRRFVIHHVFLPLSLS